MEGMQSFEGFCNYLCRAVLSLLPGSLGGECFSGTRGAQKTSSQHVVGHCLVSRMLTHCCPMGSKLGEQCEGVEIASAESAMPAFKSSSHMLQISASERDSLSKTAAVASQKAHGISSWDFHKIPGMFCCRYLPYRRPMHPLVKRSRICCQLKHKLRKCALAAKAKITQTCARAATLIVFLPHSAMSTFFKLPFGLDRAQRCKVFAIMEF